jgi:hypothetical protein
MSDKLHVEMSDEELLITLSALNNSLVDPIPPILALLTQVKDQLLVTVDVEKGLVLFGFYDGFFSSLAMQLSTEVWK